MPRLIALMLMVAALAPVALAISSPVAQTTAPQTPAGNTTPAAPTNASPQNPSAPASLDPAAATFTASGGLMFVTVKGDKASDYEDAIRALQAALSQATDEKHRAIAKGWRVFKSEQSSDPKANRVYVHLFEAAVAKTDYRPSVILDELLAGAPADLLGKYRDSIVGAPTKIGLEPFADMTLPPPANASPKGPTPGKPPGAR